VQILVVVATILTSFSFPMGNHGFKSFEGRSGPGFLTSGAHVRVSRS